MHLLPEKLNASSTISGLECLVTPFVPYTPRMIRKQLEPSTFLGVDGSIAAIYVC